MTVVSEVRRRPASQRLEDESVDLESDPLMDWQPVELPKY